jgi:hypothetical protein
MAEEQKTRWDKAQIVLQPVGGLFTALAVAAVGWFGTAALERRQTIDTNARLYAELMSKREEADSNLRKDMFNSIIGTFLEKPEKAGFNEKLLKLELLSYNFHEALDLGPLFKHVYRQISQSHGEGTDELLVRLERAARDATSKQIEALEEGGGKLDGTIDLGELYQNLGGVKVLDGTARLTTGHSSPSYEERHFEVQALSANSEKKEIRLQLKIRTPQQPNGNADANADAVDKIFVVKYFDFPMIDNIRLSHGQRCAIILRNFEGTDTEGSAEITLVYFPGSRASLKEKPFYDEVLHDVLNADKLLAEGGKN